MAPSERSYPSVWARPRRKERSTLTREQIVGQALQLLDTEGIDALSMRKLGAKLEAGATSLYWHVANRDELLELVVDEVYGELELPEAGETDWRAGLRLFATSVRATTLRHRWVVAVLEAFVGAYLGPNMSRATDRMLRVLEAGGFPLAEAERAMSTVGSYVTGYSMAEAAMYNWLQRRGQTEQEWMEESKLVADQTTQGYDRVAAVAASYEGKDPQVVAQEDFAWGLERLLDGLAAHLDRA